MSILEMTTVGNSGWIGHSGPDQAKAKAFYQEVLGWTINDMPMQNGCRRDCDRGVLSDA